MLEKEMNEMLNNTCKGISLMTTNIINQKYEIMKGDLKMEKGTCRLYQKNTEKTTNKMRIPKKFVENHGRNYYMEVYEDYIKIIPIRKNK